MFILQYHFVEDIFIFVLLPELQTERQSNQGSKNLEYIDTWRKHTCVYVPIYTHMQFNSVLNCLVYLFYFFFKFIYLLKKNFFNVYFWDRERQSMNGGGSEREGVTESETGSRLWAVSTEPFAGLKLTNCEIMTWAEFGRLTDWATQAPQEEHFKQETAWAKA